MRQRKIIQSSFINLRKTLLRNDDEIDISAFLSTSKNFFFVFRNCLETALQPVMDCSDGMPSILHSFSIAAVIRWLSLRPS